MSTHTFSAAQVESLVRLLESSVEVKRRYQFYLWTQGDLQRLVPHKFSVCGAYDIGRRDVAFEVLNSVPLGPDVVNAMSDAQSPLMTSLLSAWGQTAGAEPVWVSVRELAQRDSVASALLDEGYEWLLMHGVSRPGRPHDLESFFVFGCPHGAFDDLATHALQLFVPYLHCTYVRVYSNECEMAGQGRTPVRYPGAASSAERTRMIMNLTEREREILRWVRDGKSNQAISDELGISALTVKNHVQKILRKLGAANRAQAVAKALMMNVFNTPLSASPTRSTLRLTPPQVGDGLGRIE
jgi:transcriptional regulator EpsA